jgi:hypothetical protein
LVLAGPALFALILAKLVLVLSVVASVADLVLVPRHALYRRAPVRPRRAHETEARVPRTALSPLRGVQHIVQVEFVKHVEAAGRVRQIFVVEIEPVVTDLDLVFAIHCGRSGITRSALTLVRVKMTIPFVADNDPAAPRVAIAVIALCIGTVHASRIRIRI